MTAPDATWLFIRLIAVVCIAYDVLIMFWFGTDASISHVLARKAYDNPAIAFAAGLLCGHLFMGIFSEGFPK